MNNYKQDLNDMQSTVMFVDNRREYLGNLWMILDDDINYQTLCNPNNVINFLDETSVVVLDYSMPKTDVINLCKQLRNIPAKKLVITGQTGYNACKEALNNHVIDAVLEKNSEDFDDDLHDTIRHLRAKYSKEQYS